MKHFLLAVVLGAAVSGPAAAQDPLDQARGAAQMQAMSALSSDHQARVDDVLARVRDGQLTDARTAAKEIDAILTPAESQAVLAARDKLAAELRADRAGADGPGPGGSDGGPPGGMQDGAPPGGGRRGGGRFGYRAMRNDAGFALLGLNLERSQMRALMESARQPAQ